MVKVQMADLSGQTAVVTGSGSGIGRAIAKRLSDNGATIAVNDIDEQGAEETVEIIEDAGGEAFTAIADITDLAAVHEMVEDIVERQGSIELLVNNAGWDEMQWFVQQDPEMWERIIDINLRGQINCARAVGEVMMEESRGSIINIASDAGRVGSTGEAVYSGAKGGVIGFSKTLAREFAHKGIRVNVVSPGPTETPLVEEMQDETDLGEKILGSMASQIPLGRMAEPEDIAGAVAFFASDDSSFITGQVLSVSGGLTMAD